MTIRRNIDSVLSADNLLNGVGAVHQNEPIASPDFSPTNITNSVGVDTNTAKNADVTCDEDDPELKRRCYLLFLRFP